MKIVKLDQAHKLETKYLFTNKKYMGEFISTAYFVEDSVEVTEHYHETFTQTYLSGLNNYHCLGAIENEKILGLLCFYESNEDASWYCTSIRNSGEKNIIKLLLESAMKYNENNGRFKFYSLFSSKHAKVMRKFAFTEWANERYDYFDEFLVESKNQCKYNLHWQILYNRTLVPVDTVVRCTFLKNKFRKPLYNAGRI
jgi:hypothetical protein